MTKKILTLILALTVTAASFAGCGSESDNTDSKCTGRYIENEITLSAKPSQAGELFIQNGKNVFIDPWEMKLYTQDESTKEFTASDFPSLKELGEKTAVYTIAGAEDGSYIFGYYDLNDTSADSKACYAYMSGDQKIKKLNFDLGYSIIDSFDISDDGRIFACSFEGNVYEINIEEESAKVLFNVNKQPVVFDIVSDHLYAGDSKDLYYYDIKNNRLDETPGVLQSFYNDQNLNTDGKTASEPVCDFCKGNDGSVYIVTPNGLYRYVLNGNQVEQVLDGLSYHLGNPAFDVRSVTAQTENSFLINYNEGNVMSYSFDPDAPNKITSSLKVYSLKENATLEQIVSEFSISNPDVKVEYETGMDRDGSVTYEDAIKNLNTEICSGEAPDVIMLDGMDTENYIDKNMLADLSEYEAKIDPDDRLLDNIAKHRTDGGLYTMTCKFEIPVIVADKDNLSKINSFSDFADMVEDAHKTITDSFAAGLFTENDVLSTAIDMNQADIITDKGADTEKLRKMLEDCLKIYNSERAVYGNAELNDYVTSRNDTQAADDKWCHEVSGISMEIINDNKKLACGTADGFEYSLNIITSLNDQKANIDYKYGFTDDSRTYIPVCSLGICSAGKNKEKAADFLKTALSSSVQNVELNDGIPVNLDSIEDFYNRGVNDRGNNFGIGDPNDGGIFVKAKYMNHEETEKFQKAAEQLDTPVQLDTMTRDIIMDTGTRCLKGDIPIDEAVKEINEKLSLKLQE